ncbi:type II toxin-antitoxin system HicA family toxin [Haemophilus parahaemolyticus]|nr:type II toxin-antitoxin system HicA family toxin [Haemophilus parahaemolyticus]
MRKTACCNVTIPHPEKDMHPKTEQSILKQAGLK